VWGAIVNDSRSLVVQLKGFVDLERSSMNGSGNIIRKIAYRQIAWCYCLGQSLRKQEPIAAEQLKHLSEEEVSYITRHSNKPLALLMLHMKDLRFLHQSEAVNPFQQV
jgi:putative membrane protein